MVFTTRIVPTSFSSGRFTPVPKKNRSLNASFISAYYSCYYFLQDFCTLVMPEFTDKCYIPPYQFGFQKGLGCAQALTTLSSILIDVDKSSDSLVLGSHDVSRAFDSLSHAQILLKLYKRGVDTFAIRALYDMYNHLAVVIRLPDGTITRFVRSSPLRRQTERPYFSSCLQ